MLKVAVITDNKLSNSFFDFFYQQKEEIEKITKEAIKLISILDYSTGVVEKALIKNKNIKITDQLDEIILNSELGLVIDLTQLEKKDYLINLIKNKKTVITTNKKLIAENYSLIKKLEIKYKTKVYYSAIFSPLSLNILADNLYLLDQIKEINAVLNAASNFVLSEMQNNMISMTETVENAKILSYIEDDPESHLDGFDTLYEFVILINKLYNINIKPVNIAVKGIKGITSYDLIYAEELGYKIKLIASLKEKADNIFISLRPQLIEKNSFLASIDNNSNGLEFISKFNSKNIFKAENNKFAQANLICLDIINAVKTINSKQTTVNHQDNKKDKYKIIDLYSEQKNYFYIRIQIEKDEKIIKNIKNIFSEKNLADLILHDNLTETPLLPVIIITKKILEKDLEIILKEVEDLKGVLTVNNIIPVKTD